MVIFHNFLLTKIHINCIIKMNYYGIIGVFTNLTH